MGHSGIVKVLLDVGVGLGLGLDIVDTTRSATALIIAILSNHISIVKLLLIAGANVELATFDGLTPLIVAVTCGGYVDIIKLLLKYNVKLNTKSKTHQTALMYAMKSNHTLRLLIY